MITVRSLEKRFGQRKLFTGVTFSINRRERIGLVGLNGTGKTTLLRILIGDEAADAGEIVFPRGYRIGYLPQEPSFGPGDVLTEAARGLRGEQEGETWRAEKILSGLGFSPGDFPRNPQEFSGGYRMRICLARVILSAPDLLLLDEPTNFLDILAIRWLERFLGAWPGEILCISHDRSFLDAIATHILGIHRESTWKIPGKTPDYFRHIAQEDENWEKRRLNQERKLRQTEEFINRFRAQARHAGQVQSRIKALEKTRPREALAPIRSLAFSFNAAPIPARYVLEARELTFSYLDSGPPLIGPLNLCVGKTDRIGVIGPNGRGKTTLLKLLAGVLRPGGGVIREHPETRKSFFDPSSTAGLHDDLTVEEEVAAALREGDRKRNRGICGAMLFSGDEALKKIGIISGGEKCRVLLGKVLAAPSNLLLLDEPTHHLDLDASEALLDALEQFPGALILVSHNEHFLKKLCRQLVVFGPAGARLYGGGYEDFLQGPGWEEIGPEPSRSQPGPAISKKELRRRRAEFTARRATVLGPLKRRVEELEKAIMTLEEEIASGELALAGAALGGAGEEIVRLSRDSGRQRDRIRELYGQLELWGGKLDQEQSLLAHEQAGLENG